MPDGKTTHALQIRPSDTAAAIKEKLQRRMISLETWSKTKKASLMQQHGELTQEMYGEIVAVIARVARERGFLLVLNALPKPKPASDTGALVRQIRERQVLFADERIDIGPDVLKALNEDYARKAPAGKLPPKGADEM